MEFSGGIVGTFSTGTSCTFPTRMANYGTVIMTFKGCAVFSFMPEDRDFLCMKSKLMAVSEEMI